MNNYIVVLTATPEKDAEKIALELVESRSCACVNIISGVTSIYHWQGKLEKERESILLMKTESGKEDQIEEILKDIHPYELPELIVLPIKWGKREYLEWISEWTSSQDNKTMQTRLS